MTLLVISALGVSPSRPPPSPLNPMIHPLHLVLVCSLFLSIAPLCTFLFFFYQFPSLNFLSHFSIPSFFSSPSPLFLSQCPLLLSSAAESRRLDDSSLALPPDCCDPYFTAQLNRTPPSSFHVCLFFTGIDTYRTIMSVC